MSPPTRHRIPVATLLFCASFPLAACTTHQRLVDESRRFEESIERADGVAEREERIATQANENEGALERNAEDLDRVDRQVQLASVRAIETEVRAHRLAGEVLYSLDGLPFDVGSAALNRETRSILNQLADRLWVEPGRYALEVQGHTDPSGSPTADLRLGTKRAEAVRAYLHLEKRIPLQSLAIVSLGSSAPIAGNDTTEGRARNRRATILVLRP